MYVVLSALASRLLLPVFALVLVAVGSVTFFRAVFSTVLFRTMFRVVSLLPGIRAGTLWEPDPVLRAAVGQVRVADRTDRLLLLAAAILLAALLLAAVVRVSMSVLDR